METSSGGSNLPRKRQATNSEPKITIKPAVINDSLGPRTSATHPMNGAPMNGIVGFDGLESQYADFGSFFKLETNTKQPIETLPHDDLRKPVVYSD